MSGSINETEALVSIAAFDSANGFINRSNRLMSQLAKTNVPMA